jgi:Arylsulfotransferase (ASST)/Secretion system C-terminal sorting domain
MLKKICPLFALFVFIFIQSKSQVYDGLTLFVPNGANAGTTATLYDTSWNAVKIWSGFTSKTGYSSSIIPGGTLVRSSKGGVPPTGAPMGPICGKVQKHDYSGALIWDYSASGTDYISHHDICPMPNGNVLIICYEKKDAAAVSAAGGNNSITMWPDKIIEVEPTGVTTGNIVWEWHSWDHICQNVNNAKPNYVNSIVNSPQLLNINYKQASDWQHMNGIDYNPILDQIAISSHNLNEWYILDHSTTTAEAATHSGGNSGKGGDFLYRWGNPAAYGASGTAILNVTHDVHWIPEGVPNAGRLAGFNNKGFSSTQSCGDQIDAPVNGYNYNLVAGQAYAPATFNNRNTTTGMFTTNMGSTQQFPNGNELMCAATSGKIFEFNAAGAIVMTHTFSGAVPQVKKYSACFVNNPPPPIPIISSNFSTLTSSNATAYQWYNNGVLIVGATSSAFTPSSTGIYVVRTNDANGCVYQYSKGFSFVKFPESIANVDLSNQVSISPNPSNGIFRLDGTFDFTKAFTVNVFDFSGKHIYNKKNARNIDLSNFTNGTYALQLISANGILTKKIILKK